MHEVGTTRTTRLIKTMTSYHNHAYTTQVGEALEKMEPYVLNEERVRKIESAMERTTDRVIGNGKSIYRAIHEKLTITIPTPGISIGRDLEYPGYVVNVSPSAAVRSPSNTPYAAEDDTYIQEMEVCDMV